MDKKFFVPFKTAQQLREKGYPQESDYGYFDNGDSHPLIMFPADNFDCAAPTYHEVLDWLEEKGVRIYAECCVYWSGFIDKYETDEFEKTKLCDTREGALNAAILEALEML